MNRKIGFRQVFGSATVSAPLGRVAKWQTRWLQVPVGEIPWGFKSPLAHQFVGAVMSKLIYATNMSIDGWTEDARGGFDWTRPDDGVFAFITKLMGTAGTYLYGRRMYETLAVWETDPTLAQRSDLMADYATAWQSADKVVYSTTLAEPLTANTLLRRRFDPTEVRSWKAVADGDLLVGGPNLAAQALRAGLVDEVWLFVWPVILGGRNAALPSETRIDLELLDEHRFQGGAVFLRYRVL